MKIKLLLLIFNLLVALIGYGQTETLPQAYSLSGKRLFSPVQDPKILAKSDSSIQKIKTIGKLAEGDFIEIGKQLVATARYNEAVENYTISWHQYLTLRKLDLVIKDLLGAWDLLKSEPYVRDFEAKGNKRDAYQQQTEYHLGVYYFLII